MMKGRPPAVGASVDPWESLAVAILSRAVSDLRAKKSSRRRRQEAARFLTAEGAELAALVGVDPDAMRTYCERFTVKAGEAGPGDPLFPVSRSAGAGKVQVNL